MRLYKRYKKLSFWNRIGFISGIFGIIGFFLGLIFYVFPNEKSDFDITHAEFNDNFLTVYNSKGISWTKKFEGPILKSQVVNISSNNTKHVLVSIGKNKSLSNFDSGHLYCFNKKGGQVWMYKSDNKFNYNGGRSGKMIIKNFIVGNLKGTDNQILLNSSDANGWYQSNLSLIDKNGNLISTYWHPGFINHTVIYKEKRGSPSILFTGVNNDLGALVEGSGYLHIVGKLPNDFSGEAPPYAGRSSPGNEIWYLGILPKNNGITKFSVSYLDKDNLGDIVVWTESGHNAHLNSKGEIIRVSSTDKEEKYTFNFIKVK